MLFSCCCLLYNHTDNDVFNDFPKISNNFLNFFKMSEHYQRCPEITAYFLKTFEEDPKSFSIVHQPIQVQSFLIVHQQI